MMEKRKSRLKFFSPSVLKSLVFRLLLYSVNSPSGPWDNTASMLQGVVYPGNGVGGGIEFESLFK